MVPFALQAPRTGMLLLLVSISITGMFIIIIISSSSSSMISMFIMITVSSSSSSSSSSNTIILFVWPGGVFLGLDGNALRGALEAGGPWLQGAYPSRDLEWVYP